MSEGADEAPSDASREYPTGVGEPGIMTIAPRALQCDLCGARRVRAQRAAVADARAWGDPEEGI